jgi:ATP-dependent Clp protease ATP-binding subunit ClpA
MEAIRRIFSPEFRNRLDAVIQFSSLDPATIERVVDKLLVEVETQLEQKGVQLTVDDTARSWIARKGYDPKMGARPMARLIQDHIKRPLAEDLLFGKLVGGGNVRVTVSEDGTELVLIARSAHEPELLTQSSE